MVLAAVCTSARRKESYLSETRNFLSARQPTLQISTNNYDKDFIYRSTFPNTHQDSRVTCVPCNKRFYGPNGQKRHIFVPELFMHQSCSKLAQRSFDTQFTCNQIHSNEITFVETAKNLQKQLMPVVVIGQVLFDWKIKEAWLRQRNCAPTILCKRSFKVIQGRPC